MIKVRSSSSSDTNTNQGNGNNFLPAISLNKVALKSNLDQVNKEILTVDTHENDFLDGKSIKKRKNRLYP